MAKKIKTIIKIQLPAGKAAAGPPVGTALGPQGINLGQFVSQFNEQTREMMGSIIPAEITIFDDRTFEFKLKTPPASDLLRRAAGVPKGSGVPNKQRVGKVTKTQLREIAEKKMPDLNADSIEAAEKIIAGSARQMGIEISE